MSERERRVLEKLRRREFITRNLNADATERLTFGDRVADHVAAMIGSWRFLIIQSLLLGAWITLNVVAWSGHWDPYPFILLNLVLSFQAAYAAPIIMMSQNRQEAKDRLRAEHDYDINLKAEVEIEELQTKLDTLQVSQWGELLELQRRQLLLLERLAAASAGSTSE